jgi:hypothetical protein
MVRGLAGGKGARTLRPSAGFDEGRPPRSACGSPGALAGGFHVSLLFDQMLPRWRRGGRLPDEPRSALVSAGRNL